MVYDPRYPEGDQHNRSSNTGSAGILGGMAAITGITVVSPNIRRGVAGALRTAGRETFSQGSRAVSYLSRRYGTQVRQAGASIKALDYALDGRSPFSLLTGYSQRMEERFNRSYQASMDVINRRLQTPMKGMRTRLGDELFSFTNELESGRFTREHFEAVRQAAISRDLRKRLPENLHQPVESMISQRRDQHDFFTMPSVAKIEGLLKEYSPEASRKAGRQFSLNLQGKEREDFVKTMFDVLNTYRDPSNFDRRVLYRGVGAGGKNELDFGFEIQSLKDYVDRLRNDLLERNQAKHDGLLNRVYGRTLTVRDVLKQVEEIREDGSKEIRYVNELLDNDAYKIIRNRSGQRATTENWNFGDRVAEHVNRALRRDAKHGTNEAEKWLNLAVDSRMFIKDGKITDLRSLDEGVYRSLSFVRENFQVPFLNFNPLDLLHWTSYQAIREAPSRYLLKRGTIHPWLGRNAETIAHPLAHNQDAAVGPLNRDYMFSNGKVYDIATGEVIRDNVFLASARFGMIPRAAAGMANLHRRDTRSHGFFRRLFDIGSQEVQGLPHRAASVFTKFASDDWAPNTLRLMFDDARAIDPEFREMAFKNLYADISKTSRPLSTEVAEYINPLVQRAYGDIGVDLSRLETEEEVMSTLARIAQDLSQPSSRAVGYTGRDGSGLANQIIDTWRSYERNRSGYLKNQRVFQQDSPFTIGVWQAMDVAETSLVSKLDDVRRLIHQHAIEQVQQTQRISVGSLIRQGIESGDLNRRAIEETRGLALLTRLQDYWDPVYVRGGNYRDEALLQFFRDIRGDDNRGTPFANNLYEQIRSITNPLSAGPGEAPPQYFGLVGYTPVEKGRGHRWFLENLNEQIKSGEDPLRAGARSAWGVLGQPFAGRRNLDQVTAATMPFYYFAERLDNALAQLGLGLSQRNRGSMQSILLNQFGRRIALPYMAFEQLRYFDDQLGNAPSEAIADSYVRMHIGMAGVKEWLGLNTVGNYFSDLMPGMDQVGKIPPFAILRHASFGFFGDNRSPEELREYYESGEEPIRKGRWWGVGSNTPWEGGKINYYVPNWYRRLKSNYQYTDTLYGSSDEYWANHWMPTLTHPFAPVRHFLLDPNHWERKHYDDRPYPIQGGVPELQMIPVIGPTLDNTVGRLIKPRTVRRDLEKHHEAYLEELNEYIRSQYYANTQEGLLQLMPAGGYRILAGGAGPATEFGAGFGSGQTINAGEIAVDGSVIGSGGIGAQNAKDASRAQLAAINMGIISGQGTARSIGSLDSLRDPNVRAELADIASPFGPQQSLAGFQYNITEMAGIYGFSFRMFTGLTEEDPGLALEESGRISSYARAWWDLEMGGFGGNASEIFRRYLPRDPRKTTYNPIRNTMPDWLPGVDYFTDFQHGDPYSKIPRGEIRLPGEAYEAIHDLHPDIFGKYGAFDRFKILADVAPYSNQYRVWRRIVAQMNQAGMLTPEMQREYAEIRDQVSSRKDKYHFYPYKFRYADINKETVTVTRVLDAETFLTAEYPNNPIKLAGVQIPSDAVNTQEWLYQHIHEGAKLTIGVDADPLFRIRDDSMNTIRAVVYSGGEEGLPFYLDQKGQSLNAILVNRDFGDENRARRAPDNSAVGTAAFYNEAEITIGKLWETTIHNSGKIPIVGTILDKFVQVRSPLELYKRNEVYGRAWRPWHEPWSGWIQPMLETAAEQNPLLAAAQGYGIGWLFGRPGGGHGRRWGPFIGAAVMGGLSAMRTYDEAIGRTLSLDDDYTWIPERRRREREINQYFDVLKYMKYRGLYERAKELARRYEGVDLDEILDESRVRGQRNKEKREYLQTMKKWLSIQEKIGYSDDDTIQEQLRRARERLGEIDGDRRSFALGPYSMQAMQYRAEYESTLYGADPYGDLTQIYRAMPDKERAFFQHFMNAAPAEREEILRLIPKDQRPFYQARWGMDVDDKESLRSFFLRHKLPDASWEGWRPDVSLEAIKIKVIKNEGLEATEFGIWDDDIARAEQAYAPEIDPFKPSMLLDVARIERVLRGAGLSDVNVTIQVAPGYGENILNISMDVVKDRSQDIINGINESLSSLV